MAATLSLRVLQPLRHSNEQQFVRLQTSSTPESHRTPLSSAGRRLVAIRASSSPPPPDLQSSSNTATTLDIPEAGPPTTTSLVARTREIVSPEGAAGLVNAQAQTHYEILGVPFGACVTDVIKAFKDRQVELQAAEIDDKEKEDQLRTLRESFELLTSDEERKVYDWVLQRYQNRSRDTYVWPYETDITQRYNSPVEPPIMRSFDEEGNNKVGLFFLGMVVISIVFSVTMRTWIPYHHYAKDISGFGL